MKPSASRKRRSYRSHAANTFRRRAMIVIAFGESGQRRASGANQRCRRSRQTFTASS
jgi:hypothetical protein